MSTIYLVAASIPIVALVLIECTRLVLDRGKNYAPGPPGIPILGNLLQIPLVGRWFRFAQLAKQYGPIMRLKIAGDEMLVLSDPDDCEELLAKRSTNYSSRPPLVYAGKYRSNNKRTVILPYGEELRKQRAAFSELLNPRAVASYEVLHEEGASKLLCEILAEPADFKLHTQRFTASLVFTLTYGKKMTDDANMRAVLKVIADFMPDCAPGSHLVDSFPVLDRLPDFLAPWRREALKKHAYDNELYTRLMEGVKAEMDAGTADPCFTASLWEQHLRGNFGLDTLKFLSGSAFEASIETTTGTLMWFFVAMALFPDAQAAAQAELDAVLGETGDMPFLAHIPKLPYCVALVKEVMRWRPIAPGAFPHYSDADDEYKGFHIRKNTLVIPFIWGIHHDPARYPNPDTFEPARFMGDATDGPEALTSGHYGFGFGRRICPARYLATKSVFIAATRILWAFRIQPALDAHGKPIIVDPYKSTSSVTSEPLPFPLRITPRSAHHAEHIRDQGAKMKA